MFDSLSQRLQNTFDALSRKGRLDEKDITAGMREIRMALLEADVNYRVVKDFTQRIRERAVGTEVLQSLTPGQQVVKIVHAELISLLGEPAPLNFAGQAPHALALVGLQGVGKTTMAAKLAVHLRRRGQTPLLVAADVQRPAAIDQLETLGRQIDVPVFAQREGARAPDIAARAMKFARSKAHTVCILDTAGRTQIDSVLMAELGEIKDRVTPAETLLVVDAMTGQEAVNVAEGFQASVPLTGLIMTKVDGDARGGATLSVRQVTGVPVKFMGTSEQMDGLDVFEPERMASRILGMGDVLTLIEKAEQFLDSEQSERLGDKMARGQLDFEDFLDQLRSLKRMGSLSDLLKLLPGARNLLADLDEEDMENSLKQSEAIVNSMTLQERRNPSVLNGSRRRRIAAGSGTRVQDVNDLLKRFREAQGMMKEMSGGGRGRQRGRMRHMKRLMAGQDLR